jgi:hypothetical protein
MPYLRCGPAPCPAVCPRLPCLPRARAPLCVARQGTGLATFKVVCFSQTFMSWRAGATPPPAWDNTRLCKRLLSRLGWGEGDYSY